MQNIVIFGHFVTRISLHGNKWQAGYQIGCRRQSA